MFRIDSEGATIDNRFTEGDPGLSIPATVVSDKFLNHVQEEIIKPIEEMGLVLSDVNEGQLWLALLEFFLRGGRKNPYLATIANNTGPADVEDTNNANATLTIDRTIHKNKMFFFDIERKTATQIVKEFGFCYLSYDSKNNTFLYPKVMSLGDDGGTIFTLAQIGITDVFKLQYTSNDLTGASYVGTLDITSIIEIKQ